MARFDTKEWKEIFKELDSHSGSAEPYGLPKRRRDSVVLSSFNIRALGNAETRTSSNDKGRTQGAWDLLARYVSRCDFVAIQEVKDDLSGILRLRESLDNPEKYAMVVSDVTGARPGLDVTQERLAFLYRWDRIERTELASDITFDRRSVLDGLLSHWKEFRTDLDALDKALRKFDSDKRKHKNGTLAKKPKKPLLVLSNS